MMEGISAVESPMFDFIEQKAGRIKPEPIWRNIDKEEVVEEFLEKEIQFDMSKEDLSPYLRGPVDQTEFEVAKQSLAILEDM